MSQIQLNPVAAKQKQVVVFQGKADKPEAKAKAPARSAVEVLPKAPSALQQVYFAGLDPEKIEKLKQEAQRTATGSVTRTDFEKLNEVIPSGQEYISRLIEQPGIIRNATQRLVDAIESFGFEETGKLDDDGDKIYRYNLISGEDREDRLVGVDMVMHRLIKRLNAAAQGGEIGKRLFIMAGPHGTGKSSKINMLIRGLEQYTRTDKGAMYALSWDLPEDLAKEFKLDKNAQGRYVVDELHNDEPLLAIPNDKGQRDKLVGMINESFAAEHDGNPPYQLRVKGELSPVSELIRHRLMEYYKDKVESDDQLMGEVLKHVNARRLVVDENKRVGVGTYFPKAEKDQDVEELVGGLNYLNVMKYGNMSDPRAQGYDGEFSTANRGILYVEEYFKNKEDLKKLFLTAAQERKFKPSNTSQLQLDSVIIGASNMPEILEDMKNPHLAAHNSRVEIIPDPYVLNYKEEMGIYEKSLPKGIQVAPHTLEIASLWSTMTRLGASNTDPVRKAKGYAGEFKEADLTAAQVADEKGKFANNTAEGFDGVDPRFLQNIFSLAGVHSDVKANKTLTPIQTLRLISNALNGRNQFAPDKNLGKYNALLEISAKELTLRMQQDVMGALQEDDKMLRTYFLKYLQQLVAWKKDPEKADNDFLRAVEKTLKSPVSEAAVSEHRNDLLLKLSVLQQEGQNDQLLGMLEGDYNFRQALSRVMYNDLKNTVSDLDENRLIKNLEKKGYNEYAARETLEHLTTPGGII